MFALLAVLASATFRPDHAVSLSVVAPWYGVPIFEQLLFSMTDFSKDLAKIFLKTVLDSNQIDNETYVWSQVKNLVPTDAFALLKGKIETGFFLPRAELYRETARVIDGSNYRDLFTIGNPVASDLPSPENLTPDFEPFQFDLVINSLSNSYVYANLHTEAAAKYVNELLDAGASFILRPLAKTDKFGINLRGYGIEMRPFKYSMEYGVKNSEVLAGKTEELGDVKDDTMNYVNGVPKDYVNVTAIEDFAAHFAGFLESKMSEGADYLTLVRDVAQNYPLFMDEIAQAKPNMMAVRMSSYGKEDSRSYSILNGRVLPVKNIDTFTLLETIQEESNMRTILESAFRLNKKQIDDMSRISIPYKTPYVFEWESKFVYYFNNIETDPETEKWETTVAAFVGSQRPHMIRKNLLNLVLYGDFTCEEDLTQMIAMAQQLTRLLQAGLPLRLGIVPYVATGNKLSRKVGYAIHYLAEKDPSVAVGFLLNVLEYVGVSPITHQLNTPREIHFASAYAQTIADIDGVLSWSELHTLYDEESSVSKTIAELHAYLKDAGIHQPKVLLNGKEMSLQNGMKGIMYEIERMLMLLQQVCSHEHITSFDGVTAQDLMAYPYIVVPQFDENVLYETPIGIGLFDKTLSVQMDFIDWIGQIEWNLTDEGQTSAFYILFSKNETEIEEFMTFAKSKHDTSAVFAVNPAVPESIIQAFDWNMDETMLIADGRVFNTFTAKKLIIIDKWAASNVYAPIASDIEAVKYKRSNALIYFSCIFCDWRNLQIKRNTINGAIWERAQASSLIYDGFNDEIMTWDLVINPFTREFQRLIGIAQYLAKIGAVNVRLVLQPPEKMTEPISTYYRNALDTDNAVFTMLNDTTTYSSMTDMPDSWIFESMKAIIDLDNILLMELSPSVHEGKYVLTNIKAEGSCQIDDRNMAEGAELALFDKQGNKQSDTTAMMLTGYWQLAANPGQWVVDLGGRRSKMIYELKTRKLTISSFAQPRHVLRVSVNPGMEGIKVYNISVGDTSNTTTVNVFSVASGHLYERLLKIMMLAVRRRSQYNVKFWIIKTFLSPQFKATLPIMAKKYNFSYQLISYKWPTWLRPQYEKQRIIWGNKILFLDVIFPLDLDRVIYIDSDQVVRTDLIELMRMDFEGAPYAFTPFCDSKKETEGFRFWKQGYWLKHLEGKPYHISALFAIDLAKFRQMAAGDWLRYYYQRLSGDAESLSNLDQDLPNYAQFHIPIYSLPQNWLWCETWCSDETMDEAKTIDLCNNPLTKAPKLHIAQTRIREWPGLDEEVRNISAGPDDYEKFFFPE